MKPSIFITGITGLLGRALLKKIDPEKYNTIYCLIVDKSTLLESYPDNFKKIPGDLNDQKTYKNILENVETVIHMASVTGKVSPQEYNNNIVLGTAKLLNNCKEHGVKNFVYISSIAAKFKKIKRYYYGIAKKEAEKIVKNSGLNYSIIRPTMIMGANSAVFEGFSNLASLPIIPVFGNGKTKIQPVADIDVAESIISILDKNHFQNKILEIGGPEILSIDEFLTRIKSKKNTQKKKAKMLHIPIGLTVFGLSMLETIVYKFLPITVGQLASFRNDSTATNDPFLKNPSELVGIEELIEKSSRNEKNNNKVNKILIKECRTFCKYLSGIKANDYVTENYIKYHDISQIEKEIKLSPFDKVLLKIARIHPVFTKFIDIYTKFFKPLTLIRYKITYLLAILEVSSPYYQEIDFSTGISKFGFIVLLGIRGGIFALQLLLSIIFLLPFDLLFRILGKNKKELENA